MSSPRFWSDSISDHLNNLIGLRRPYGADHHGAEMAEAAKAARKRKPGRPPKAAAGWQR